MSDEDDLERLLRGALTRPRHSDAVDTDDFLSRVHHGAKVRRVKRGVSLAAASVLAVAGGGVALDVTGLLGGSKAPMATGRTSVTLPTTSGTTGSKPPPTTASSSSSSQTQPTEQTFLTPEPVTISPKSVIAAKDVQPLSLTATGSAFQWVLAKTPNTGGSDCSFKQCASVFATGDHGTKWTDVGQLPAPPAASADAPTLDSVSQLRFTKRDDTTYDGWAYGSALWSTHDSGHSWSPSGTWDGEVTALESWGTDVYAGVSSSTPGGGATLYRSPTSTDDWQPVSVTAKGLTSIDALAAAKGVVGLIDGGKNRPTVYLSRTGADDSWQKSAPCPPGTNPTALSSAGDSSGTGAIWVTCQGISDATIRVTDTNHLGSWSSVSHDKFPVTVAVAAMSPTVAFVAGDKVNGIQMVPTTGSPTVVWNAGVGTPVLFGFTNPSHGYLLASDGSILSTVDGGLNWEHYSVSDTKP